MSDKDQGTIQEKESPNGWFILAAFVVLGLGYYLEVFQLVELMWPSGLICIALLFFAHIDKLKKFKIGPLEAELRDEIKKARASIAQVQDLAVTLAATSLALVHMTGRMDGFSDEGKAEQEKIIFDQLDRLGVNPQDHQVIFDLPFRCTELDYVLLIARVIRHETKLEPKQLNELNEITNTGVFNPIAGPDALTRFMTANGCVGDASLKLLDDYRYYKEHRKHRRPEVWAERYGDLNRLCRLR